MLDLAELKKEEVQKIIEFIRVKVGVPFENYQVRSGPFRHPYTSTAHPKLRYLTRCTWCCTGVVPGQATGGANVDL
jgi:hypothetical protein